MKVGEPAALPYHEVLDELRRGQADPVQVLERLSELLALLDLTTTLGSSLSGEEILDAALLIVMGQLKCRRGCLLVRSGPQTYEVRAARGLPPGAPATVPLVLEGADALLEPDSAAARAALEGLGLELLCPVSKGGRPIAALGLGGRGRAYGRQEAAFLRSVAACAAAPLDSVLVYEEMKRLNQRLSVKVFQLHSLFDITRELTASLDEDSILQVVSAALMGHLMVSRCAVFLPGNGGLQLSHERGSRTPEQRRVVPEAEARRVLAALEGPRRVEELPEGALRETLQAGRLSRAVPLGLDERPEGLLAFGERPTGAPMTDEDLEFALTLARQAAVALQTVRLHRMRVEKQRQDRELQIARGIQQSLFPQGRPVLPGFDLAARSLPCFEVGGDHYDVIGLQGGGWALVVADVAGKGTPASLLMASVHAWLRALAGTASPGALLGRLNGFLCENTEANRFVTLFYAQLDPPARRLRFANAGHVPPFLLRASGARERLTAGGPALGLIEGADYEEGQTALEPADVLAVVTDGVTEALSVHEAELGDGPVFAALEERRAAGAEALLEGLVAAVARWTGGAGSGDDLTAMVLKASPPR